MRFLHTSDWHVGKPIRNHRRDDEYEAALAEVLDIAKREAVDCVLVAGDVFDSVAPPPEAERLVFDFFRELVGTRIPAVVIAGNHDHPRRMNAFSRVLDLVQVHVRGEPAVAEEGGVVEVASRDSGETAVIAALPWVGERKVREFESLMGGEHFGEYAQGVSAMMTHLCRAFRKETVNLLLTHVLLEDSKVGGPESGERPIHMSQAYVVKTPMLPSSPQYVALGHVHMPQEFPLANAYYCGSLLQCDFGEAGQKKRVNIVDVKPGAKAKIEPVALTSIKQLRNVGSHKEGVTLDEIKTVAPEVADDYVKVFLKVDAPVQGLAEQVRDLLPNAVDIVVQRGESEETAPDVDISRESPPELFGAYYRDAHGGKEPPKELMALFNRLYEEASAASD
jgi:exonuclease SbcD